LVKLKTEEAFVQCILRILEISINNLMKLKHENIIKKYS
jgi:hypothetical protein